MFQFNLQLSPRLTFRLHLPSSALPLSLHPSIILHSTIFFISLHQSLSDYDPRSAQFYTSFLATLNLLHSNSRRRRSAGSTWKQHHGLSGKLLSFKSHIYLALTQLCRTPGNCDCQSTSHNNLSNCFGTCCNHSWFIAGKLQRLRIYRLLLTTSHRSPSLIRRVS